MFIDNSRNGVTDLVTDLDEGEGLSYCPLYARTQPSVWRPMSIPLLSPCHEFMLFRNVQIWARPKRPFAERPFLPVHEVLGLQIGIVEYGGLIHVDIFPVRSRPEPAVFHHFKEEGRARVRGGDVEQCDIQGKRFGNGNRFLNRLYGLTG